ADAEGEPNAGETASGPAREWLASSMHHSLNSSNDAAHGGEENPDGMVVLSKAGWINGAGDYYALNDAG
ncbi:hypothetical protein LIP41_08550, partial [Bifidobacterium animalis]|nr:hypothetical protein [Bifidobacterium animalis]